MSERRKWTPRDLEDLIEAMKAEPGRWQAYVRCEVRDKTIDDDVAGWILRTMHKLFPDQSLSEVTDLLFLLRRETQSNSEFGMRRRSAAIALVDIVHVLFQKGSRSGRAEEIPNLLARNRDSTREPQGRTRGDFVRPEILAVGH